MFRIFSIGRWCCLMLGLLSVGARQTQGQSKEYQVKAAFLLNFTQFVEWPASAFAATNSPFCIGLLGDDPFGPALAETVRGENIQGHNLTVRRGQKLNDLRDCQVIFIGKSEEAHVPEILAKIDSRPVMTVGEMTGFAKRGGTINFYRQQNKVRFEINPEAARARGLKISSQLLALGKIVDSHGGNK